MIYTLPPMDSDSECSAIDLTLSSEDYVVLLSDHDPPSLSKTRYMTLIL